MKTGFFALLSLFSAGFAFSATSLIGTNARNGSFESGAIAPWYGGGQVVEDPLFASDGTHFLTLHGTAPTPIAHVRELAFQFFSANPTNGRTFLATFAARAGINGFDELSVDFFARSSTGSFIGGVETPVSFPALSSSEWRTYQVQYVLPDGWTGDGEVSLQILFSKPGAAAGISYTGYLDNVQLQALPAPLPRLTIVHTDQTLTVSWPGDGTNYVLEMASALSGGVVWQRVTNSPSMMGGHHSVAVGAATTNCFFRLKSEP